MHNIQKVHKGIRGIVIDDRTKLPIKNCTIQIQEVNHNVTTYDFGDYWRVLAPGHYNVIASHPK